MSERDILGEHCDRADAWLASGFGDRLAENERLAIRRVLFARAWQAYESVDTSKSLPSAARDKTPANPGGKSV